MISAPVKMIAMLIAMSVLGASALAQSAADAARAWGFDRSDLAPHPDVRFGVLPNGMRYALMQGAAPVGGLSARLRIGTGAAVETSRERGFMHLIEHLIFQGSANLPPIALPLMLRREGLARAADFRAETGWNETTYSLDLPRSDARARATALTVMREVASGLAFERRLVDPARAAVLAELREQDTTRERLLAAQDTFFFPGSPVARGRVGGDPKRVARATGPGLRRLYRRHYVPANATLVLAGDLDPQEAEREVAARFGDWRPGSPDPAGAAPLPPPARAVGLRARVFLDPEAETAVTLASVEPLAPDAGARRDAAFLEYLGAEMLGRRLTRRNRPAGDFAAAYDRPNAGRIARVDVAATTRDWRRALGIAASELARALTQGFPQAELDAYLEATRARTPAAAGPRTTRALADAIVDAANRGLVFTRPPDATAEAVAAPQVRAEAVDAAFRRLWSNPTRSIFVSHDRPIPGGEAAVAAAWRDAAPAPNTTNRSP